MPPHVFSVSGSVKMEVTSEDTDVYRRDRQQGVSLTAASKRIQK